MNSLDTYLTNLDGLISKLSPQQTRELARQIGNEMRSRTAARIKANVTPGGMAYPARQGEAWKARRLRAGESLKPGQKFGYFKSHNLQMKYLIDKGDRFVGEEITEGNPGYKAGGFLKKYIYIHQPRKSGLMFKRLPGRRWLKSKTTAAEAAIGFMGGLMAEIAAEHHYGNPSKNLPSREMIGFAPEDLRYIEDTIIKHLQQL
ncbi:phage virion morphogenesis protein [Neisseria sp. S1]|uniref:phage virion morphogenesis protein n=1 Tax=Neisseria sp. S1 TaxID=3318354 RepID=UPI003A886386